MPDKLVRLLEALYTDNSIRVQVNGFLSRPISVRAGVRQGCPASPLLFNVYVDLVMRCFARRCRELHIEGFKVLAAVPGREPVVRELSHQLCADDQVLLNPTMASLQQAFGVLDEVS